MRAHVTRLPAVALRRALPCRPPAAAHAAAVPCFLPAPRSWPAPTACMWRKMTPSQRWATSSWVACEPVLQRWSGVCRVLLVGAGAAVVVCWCCSSACCV